MPFDPTKGHAALRRGRFSQTAGEYFLTLCTVGKRAGLTSSPAAGAILHEARAMSADHTWRLRSVVVMPDHVHALIVLGARLSLAKSVQRLKAKTAAALRGADLGWERGFFDRQLRLNDDRLAIFLYLYLNPYRAGLLPATAAWPHYWCCDEDWLWFRGLLQADRPSPEWL